MQVATPKVFISYAWTNDAHVNWVTDLATRLQSDGIEVVFDQWDLKRGHDKYAFMERMVTDQTVTKVISICDAKYAIKADDRAGGVGTESQIISPEIYTKTSQEKFIPLVRERDPGTGEPFVPTFFKTIVYIDFSDDTTFEESYDALVRDIYGAPAKKRPPLGKTPAHILAPTAVHLKTASTFLRLKHAVETQKPFVSALFNEYLDIFIASLEDFRISVKDGKTATFDEEVIASIKSFVPYRDQFVECATFMLRYAPGRDTNESLIRFIEQFMAFQTRPDSVNSWHDVDYDNYRFLMYELFLYLIAACIRHQKFDAAAEIIESDYHIPKTLGGGDFYSCGASELNNEVESLDRIRNQRENARHVSYTAAVVTAHTPSPAVMRDIIQADFLLFLRRNFPAAGSFDYWLPRCFGYAKDRFELFSKASTDRGLTPLKTLFRISSQSELMDGLEKTFQGQFGLNMGLRSVHMLPHILNLDELNGMTGRSVLKRR